MLRLIPAKVIFAPYLSTSRFLIVWRDSVGLVVKLNGRLLPPCPADGLAYSALLKNELLGAGIEKVQDPQTEDRRLQPSTPERRSLFNVRGALPPALWPRPYLEGLAFNWSFSSRPAVLDQRQALHP